MSEKIPWTEEEISYLRENYSSKTLAELMGCLTNRSKIAIKGQATRLGLERDRKYNLLSDKTKDQIRLVKKQAEAIVKVSNEILAGTTLVQACQNNGIDSMRFRKMMQKASNMPKTANPRQINMEAALSPEEKLYLDVINEDIKNVDAIPDGLDELWQIALDAITVTPRAKTALHEHYWNNRGLENIAQDYHVCRETIRHDIAKTIRKLRFHARYFVAYGPEHYMAAMETKQQWYKKAEEIANDAYQGLQDNLQAAAKEKHLDVLEKLLEQVSDEIKKVESENPTKIESMPGIPFDVLNILKTNGIEYLTDIRYRHNSLILQAREKSPELERRVKTFINQHAIAIFQTPETQMPNWKNAPIEDLGLSTRAYNCLCRENIRTTAQLAEKTEDEIASIRNIGRKSVEDIIEKAARFGIRLKE